MNVSLLFNKSLYVIVNYPVFPNKAKSNEKA